MRMTNQERTDQKRFMEWLGCLKGPRGEDGHHAHDILEEICMNGHCYNFAKAVQLLFPRAVMYAVGYTEALEVSHVVIQLGDTFYDIQGEVRMDERGYAWWHPLTPEEEELSRRYVYSFRRRGGYRMKGNP